MMVFRTATRADLNAILELFVDTITRTANRDYNPDQIIAWTEGAKNKERWGKAIEEQYFILAIKNQTLHGFASLKDNAYIDFLYVSPVTLRQGVAKTLYLKLESLALSLGQKTLSADVSITAKPFFEKMGFKAVKTNYNVRNNVELINYHMVKQLAR